MKSSTLNVLLQLKIMLLGDSLIIDKNGIFPKTIILDPGC